MPKKLTYEEAKERFKDRDDIKLCKDGYIKWSQDAKFYDFIIKKIFYAIPRNVYNQKSCHPERSRKINVEKRTFSFEEVKEKFNDRDDIELCKDGFNGWKKESKFWDNVEQDYFWTIPYSVYKRKSCHPARGRKAGVEKRTFSFEDARKKFDEQGRTDIELCKDGFNGWKKESKFWDNVEQDYFWSTPSSVFNYQICHSKRSNKNRSKLMRLSFEAAVERFQKKERYDIILIKDGFNGWKKESKFWDIIQQDYFYACPSDVCRQNSSHPARKWEKYKQTNLRKIGVENPFQLDKTKEQIKKTNIEKRGVENPMQCEIVKNKHRQTCQNKYNVDNYSQTDECKQKVVIIKKERFGYENNSQSPEYKKYLSNRIIEELDVYLFDWYKLQPEPKPAYITLITHFPNEAVSLKELEIFLKNYKENKTKLEVFTENLFNVKHYNRKPNELKKLYKPDFKLDETTYLNVDGLYWHAEINKNKWYHFNLRKEFEGSGLRIFQFYENEIYKKSDIIKSIVNSYLNIFENKINVENCNILIISQTAAGLFLNQNSLKGAIEAKHIGLYYDQQLVSIISYNLVDNVCKIERFCSVLNTKVVDDFSVLFSYLQNNCLNTNITEIRFSVDLRYEIGDFLLTAGFLHEKDAINYTWTDYKNTYDILTETITKTYKIWDAGQRLYIKKIK